MTPTDDSVQNNTGPLGEPVITQNTTNHIKTILKDIITGPATYAVGGQTSNGHGHLSLSVALHGKPAGGCNRSGRR